MALRALADVGDASLGEWEEWSGYAFHLRRRLSHEEAMCVGPVVDVRGTHEGQRRCGSVKRYVPTAIWSEECEA